MLRSDLKVANTWLMVTLWLSTGLDLESPRRHNSVCVCQGVTKDALLRREDPPGVQ